MEWAISGTYLEACNCEVICPCRRVGGRAGGRSTYGTCQGALSWAVLDGRADRVLDAVDQFIRVEAGHGKALLNGEEHDLEDGSAVVIPAALKTCSSM